MSEIVKCEGVKVRRDGQQILGPIDLHITDHQRWVIVGPNGAGKSTLLNLMATHIHPSEGKIAVLGEQLGRVDVFELRTRIGLTNSAITVELPEDEKVLDVVMSAAYAILGRWLEDYDLWDESRALGILTTLGIRNLKDRSFSTLSDGEKKRTLIARALMPNPELLLLDEPAAGLDLAAREDLLHRLENLSADSSAPVTVIVTHHLEEIPRGTTHALLLKAGEIVAAGPIENVLTAENLTQAYGLDITLLVQDGRYFARAK